MSIIKNKPIHVLRHLHIFTDVEIKNSVFMPLKEIRKQILSDMLLEALEFSNVLEVVEDLTNKDKQINIKIYVY